MGLSGTSRVGALGVGAALLLGAAGCSNPSVYDPAKELIKADTDGDGVLTREEAAKFIINKFDKIPNGVSSRTTDTYTRRQGLSQDEIDKAREFGEQAKKYLPEHGRVFLETLAILEKTYRDPLENQEIVSPSENK